MSQTEETVRATTTEEFLDCFDNTTETVREHLNRVQNEREEMSENITPTKKYKSKIWEHFTKESIDGTLKSKCNYFGSYLGGSSTNETSHLIKHHGRCKKVPNIDLLKDKQIVEADSFDDEEFRKNVAIMIIFHDYPLSMVEHIKFRSLLEYVHQKPMRFPSRNTTRKDVLKIYKSEKARVKLLLQKNESRIAITTDMWTSTYQRKGYMVVTAHFIDDKWVLQSFLLRFVYVPCPHKSETLANVLTNTLLEWNLDYKLSTITVDNCSTNDVMINDVVRRLHKRYLLSNGEYVHMRCCAHILNLIVKDGLDVIKSSIEKVRDSVVYWLASPRRIKEFENHARTLGLHMGNKLSLDCPTRWNSTFFMLRTALQYKLIFRRCSLRDNQYKHEPNDSEWDLAQMVCERLELFFNATELFSSTKYPTANICFAKICEIKLTFATWIDSSNEKIQDMTILMMSKFDKYWFDTHILMAVACILDPRSKLKLVQYYFTRFYPSDWKTNIDEVRQKFYHLLNEYTRDVSNAPITTSNTNILPSMSTIYPADFTSFCESDEHMGTQMKSELDMYLEEKLLPTTMNIDVLVYWKGNFKYPTLRAIARDLLAILVSTVASESAFSTSGRIVGPHRSRLNVEMVEALMCAKSWLSGEPPNETSFMDADIDLDIDYNEDIDDVEERIG